MPLPHESSSEMVSPRGRDALRHHLIQLANTTGGTAQVRIAREKSPQSHGYDRHPASTIAAANYLHTA